MQRQNKAFVVDARRLHIQVNVTGSAVLQGQPAGYNGYRAAVIFYLFSPYAFFYVVIQYAENKNVFTYVYAYRKHRISSLTMAVTPVSLVHTESGTR